MQFSLVADIPRQSLYQHSAAGFNLSTEGLLRLQLSLVLSRYIGLVEITLDGEPLIDVLLDATETSANPSVRAFVKRSLSLSGGLKT